MPIYEYECDACGEIIEKWQKMSDSPLSSCTRCGGSVHKLISRSSFHLKGSGWYVTDYAGRKDGESPKPKSEKAAKKKKDKPSSESKKSS